MKGLDEFIEMQGDVKAARLFFVALLRDDRMDTEVVPREAERRGDFTNRIWNMVPASSKKEMLKFIWEGEFCKYVTKLVDDESVAIEEVLKLDSPQPEGSRVIWKYSDADSRIGYIVSFYNVELNGDLREILVEKKHYKTEESHGEVLQYIMTLDHLFACDLFGFLRPRLNVYGKELLNKWDTNGPGMDRLDAMIEKQGDPKPARPFFDALLRGDYGEYDDITPSEKEEKGRSVYLLRIWRMVPMSARREMLKFIWRAEFCEYATKLFEENNVATEEVLKLDSPEFKGLGVIWNCADSEARIGYILALLPYQKSTLSEILVEKKYYKNGKAHEEILNFLSTLYEWDFTAFMVFLRPRLNGDGIEAIKDWNPNGSGIDRLMCLIKESKSPAVMEDFFDSLLDGYGKYEKEPENSILPLEDENFHLYNERIWNMMEKSTSARKAMLKFIWYSLELNHLFTRVIEEVEKGIAPVENITAIDEVLTIESPFQYGMEIMWKHFNQEWRLELFYAFMITTKEAGVFMSNIEMRKYSSNEDSYQELMNTISSLDRFEHGDFIAALNGNMNEDGMAALSKIWGF